MLLTIQDKNGFRFEAVLLAANRERMRVAIHSQRDTVELHRVDASWYMENGSAIEIEALVPVSEADFSGFCAAVYPRTNAVGRTFEAGPFSTDISGSDTKWTWENYLNG